LRSGGDVVADDRSIEFDENCAEVVFGSFGVVRLKFLLDSDDKGGADRGEQTSLGTWSTLFRGEGNTERTKIKVVLRSSLYFCMFSVSYSVVSRLYMV
jgi:hypothetical protein